MVIEVVFGDHAVRHSLTDDPVGYIVLFLEREREQNSAGHPEHRQHHHTGNGGAAQHIKSLFGIEPDMSVDLPLVPGFDIIEHAAETLDHFSSPEIFEL